MVKFKVRESVLIDFLSLQNLWWKGGFPSNKLFDFKRRDFYQYKNKELPSEKITALIGTRRVGKSTSIFELINHLIKDRGVDPKRIIYLPMNEPKLKRLDDPIHDNLKIYSKYVLGEELQELDEKIYVFFDEIQEIASWGDSLKTIYDLKYNMKLFVSGSSSIRITDEAAKLAGRISLRIMLPLKFSDFITYKQLKNEDFCSSLLSLKMELRDALKEALHKQNPQLIYDVLLKTYSVFSSDKNQINEYLTEYLIKGGYPELVEISDYSICAERLNTTFMLGFHKDMSCIPTADDPKTMQELVSLIAQLSSNLTYYAELGRDIYRDDKTVKKYIYHLENSFICGISQNYRSHIKKTLRKQRFKIFLTDVGVRNALTSSLNSLILKDETEMAKVVETVVYDHSRRLKFNLNPNGSTVYFWGNGSECDCVLNLFGYLLPIEVKDSPDVNMSKLKGLREFMDHFRRKSKFGIVITRDTLDLRNNILVIPLWLYLVMC